MLQLSVSNELRGRAMGIWVLALGFGPIGHLELGSVAEAVGLTNGSPDKRMRADCHSLSGRRLGSKTAPTLKHRKDSPDATIPLSLAKSSGWPCVYSLSHNCDISPTVAYRLREHRRLRRPDNRYVHE